MPVKRVTKWKPIFLVQVYRMVRLGIPDEDICRTLKVSRVSLYKWRKDRPELEEAIQMARKERDESRDLTSWIYKRLSPEMQDLWTRIQSWHEQPGGHNLVELSLQDHGLRVRQQLFLHALCVLKFNPSEAMRAVNITKYELDKWLASDLEFSRLVDEMQWHKGNFFEQALYELVEQGNPSAVMFANKTFNRKRGYGQTAELNVKHSGQVLHGVIDLTEIMHKLSPESKAEIMTALRDLEEQKKQKIIPYAPDTRAQIADVISQNLGEEA